MVSTINLLNNCVSCCIVKSGPSLAASLLLSENVKSLLPRAGKKTFTSLSISGILTSIVSDTNGIKN